MVSGGIFLGGRTELDILNLKEGKFTSEYYEKVMEKIYLPKLRELDLRFEQDGASSHRSKYTKENMVRWGVEPLKWPAHSPDLSPVEQMWNIIRLAAFDKVYDTFE
jgi:transposase